MASGSHGPAAVANHVGFPVSWYWKGYVRAGCSHTHFSRTPIHGIVVMAGLGEGDVWSVSGMVGKTYCVCSGRIREGAGE